MANQIKRVMKELSIEEKARRYDEAKINGSRLWECGEITRENYEYMFPEIEESEDERIRIGLIEACKQSIIVGGFHKDKVIAWLEKQGKTKSYSWKPSEEQLEALDYAYNSCPDTERGNYYEGVLETLIEDLHILEKQGEQEPVEWSGSDRELFELLNTVVRHYINNIRIPYDKREEVSKNIVPFIEKLKFLQPKQEWNEEDEKTIQLLIKIIETNFDNGAMFKVSWITPEKYMPKDKVIERIKSLRPQNTWKPSEEQMNLLQAIVNEPNNAASESCQMVLKEVIRQLKVL